MTQNTSAVPLNEVVTDSYEQFDDMGATYRVFECIDDYEYDRIVIRFDVGAAAAGRGGTATRGTGDTDDVPYQMRLYEDGSDEPAETIAFMPRNHRFSPISVIGKGETDHLQGVSPTINDYSDIPCIAHDAWKAIGFSVIPAETGWSL